MVTLQFFMKATHLEQIANDYERAEEIMEGIKRQESVRRTSNNYCIPYVEQGMTAFIYPVLDV